MFGAGALGRCVGVTVARMRAMGQVGSCGCDGWIFCEAEVSHGNRKQEAVSRKVAGKDLSFGSLFQNKGVQLQPVLSGGQNTPCSGLSGLINAGGAGRARPRGDPEGGPGVTRAPGLLAGTLLVIIRFSPTNVARVIPHTGTR